MRRARGKGCKEDSLESSYIREMRLVFSGITLVPPISPSRIDMFKLFLFGAFLAFAAAAPAPAPGDLIASYNSISALPLFSNAAAPLIYTKTYPVPIAYNYGSPYAHISLRPQPFQAGYY